MQMDRSSKTASELTFLKKKTNKFVEEEEQANEEETKSHSAFFVVVFFFLYFISINYLFWICLRWIYLWSFRIDQWHLLLLLICAFVRIFRFICIYLFIVHHMRRSVILVAITHERTAKTRLINGMAFHPIRLFAFLLSLNIDERLSQQKPE